MGWHSRSLNQAVKRNKERFPEDFMFQLTKEECLRSQIVTLNEAFVTYQQLFELPIAATYIELRKEIEAVRAEVNEILADQNDINEDTRAQLDAISLALAELQAKEPIKKERKPIGFIQLKED